MGLKIGNTISGSTLETAKSIMAYCKKPVDSQTGVAGNGMFDAFICLAVANHESNINVIPSGRNELTSTYKYCYQQSDKWLASFKKQLDISCASCINISDKELEEKTSDGKPTDKAKEKLKAISDIAAITTKLFLYGTKWTKDAKWIFEGYKNCLNKELRVKDSDTPTVSKLKKESEVLFEKLNKITKVEDFVLEAYVLLSKLGSTEDKIKMNSKIKCEAVTKLYEANEWRFIGGAIAFNQGWAKYVNSDGKSDVGHLINFVAKDIGQNGVYWREKFELAIKLIEDHWANIAPRSVQKDSLVKEEIKVVVKKPEDVRNPSGIWKLFNLDYININNGSSNNESLEGFGAIDLLRINDISYASSIGSFMNLFNKINQEPFVQNFGNSNGILYDRTVRLSPFTKSLWNQLSYYTVDKTNVYSDNLFWETDGIYSWYRLIPSGNFWGDTSNVLEYLPAVFFPEYAEVFGSKPLDVTCNYVSYESVGRNVIESSLKLLRFMIECHAYMPFTRKGEIKITYSPNIKIGQRLRYLPTGEIFYIDSVRNYVNCGNTPNAYTIVKVSRGMLEDVEDYFDLIVFDEEVVENKVGSIPPPSTTEGFIKKYRYKSFYFNDSLSKFDTKVSKVYGIGKGEQFNFEDIDNSLLSICADFLNALGTNNAYYEKVMFNKFIIKAEADETYFKYKRYAAAGGGEEGDGWVLNQVKEDDYQLTKNAKYYVSSYFYKILIESLDKFEDKDDGLPSYKNYSIFVGKTQGSDSKGGYSYLPCPFFIFSKGVDKANALSNFEVLGAFNTCCVLSAANGRSTNTTYEFNENNFRIAYEKFSLEVKSWLDLEKTITLNNCLKEFKNPTNNPLVEEGVECKINYKTILSRPKKIKVTDSEIDNNNYANDYSDYALNLAAIKEVGDYLIALVDRFYDDKNEGERRLYKPITIYGSASSEQVVDKSGGNNANKALAKKRTEFVAETIRKYCFEKIKNNNLPRYSKFSNTEDFNSYFDFNDVKIGKYVCSETDNDTKFFSGLIQEKYTKPEKNINPPPYITQFVKNDKRGWEFVNRAIARFHHEFRGVRLYYDQEIPIKNSADVATESTPLKEAEKRLKWHVNKKVFKNLLTKRHYGLKKRYNNQNG
jgi:hypothetical protein